MNKNKALSLRILDYAQIKEASLDFGGLTVLVGRRGVERVSRSSAQGGQSTARRSSRRFDKPVRRREGRDIVNLIFGVGMGRCVARRFEGDLRGQSISPRQIFVRGKDTGSAFFIPAHRSC
jgi:hypothetical protein